MDYDLKYDLVLTGYYSELLISGVEVTLILFATCWISAFAIALLLAGIRTLPGRIPNALVSVFVEYQRNIPALVHMLVWYFGVSAVLPPAVNAVVNRGNIEFLYGAIALSLYYGAFMSEDIRSGLRAIPRGQYDGARAIGLSTFNVLRLVILPQAVRFALPPMTNQSLNLFKNTSVAAAIGVAELMYRTREVTTDTFRVFEAFSLATVFYFVGNWTIVGTGYLLSRWLRAEPAARS